MPQHPSWLDDPEKREHWVSFIQSLDPTIEAPAVRLMDELRLVSKTIYHLGESSVDEAGRSFAQYRVLIYLFFAEQMGERQNLNPSEISERHGVSRNTASALIRTLEEDGLVERSLDEDDRRKFNIGLTDEGRELVREHARQHFQTIGRCFHALTPAEQQTALSQLLHKINQPRHRPLAVSRNPVIRCP
ncbi:MAG: MarR family transcriptional regulator [Chloroflexi bacterium]|nr:MarR family transcriptional regulator [Chloroflexota bacterium]